jgi:hypothetical protein
VIFVRARVHASAFTLDEPVVADDAAFAAHTHGASVRNTRAPAIAPTAVFDVVGEAQANAVASRMTGVALDAAVPRLADGPAVGGGSATHTASAAMSGMAFGVDAETEAILLAAGAVRSAFAPVADLPGGA